MYNLRTDLALETREIYRTANKIEAEIPGVETEEEKDEDLVITRVKILSEEGEKAIGKPKGNYITIDIKDFKYTDEETREKIGEKVGTEIKEIIEKNASPKDNVLVVGLGNLNVTPDSLRTQGNIIYRYNKTHNRICTRTYI